MNKSDLIMFYFFTDSLTEIQKKNILKFKNLAIIYAPQNKLDNSSNFDEIKKFCKKKRIKVFIEDNIKLAKRLDLDGVLISGHNKIMNSLNVDNMKKNFKILGKVHNQLEFYFKNRQNCSGIFFSPLFKNHKYRDNQIKEVLKFNLTSKNWKPAVYALGGINLNNLKKVKMTKVKAVGFVSLMSDPKLKKPVSFLKTHGLY